ncbi:MAG: hypothetical protein V1726_01530 [Methanobacteriota archaeon]
MKFKIKIKRKKQQPPAPEKKDENPDPLFYCRLCSRFFHYSELIDGFKCASCDNEFFLVSWKEFKDIFPTAKLRPIPKKTKALIAPTDF